MHYYEGSSCPYESSVLRTASFYVLGLSGAFFSSPFFADAGGQMWMFLLPGYSCFTGVPAASGRKISRDYSWREFLHSWSLMSVLWRAVTCLTGGTSLFRTAADLFMIANGFGVSSFRVYSFVLFVVLVFGWSFGSVGNV